MNLKTKEEQREKVVSRVLRFSAQSKARPS